MGYIDNLHWGIKTCLEAATFYNSLFPLYNGLSLSPEAYASRLDEIKSAVHSLFPVADVRYVAGVLTFTIPYMDIKRPFKELYGKLREIGFVPTAERDGDSIILKVYPYRPPRTSSIKVPLLLLVATCITVFLDGYIKFTVISRYASSFYEGFNALYFSSLFTLALIGIIGIHELGHKISAKIDRIDSSLPYFIPGIPGEIPTFGAVIFQRSPVVNKDDLFDLGISGPVAGFVVSLIVLYLAFSTSIWIPYAEAERLFEWMLSEGAIPLPRPAIFYVFEGLMGGERVPLLTFTPFAFPAWLGMLVTGLNMMPIWQLDGGRVLRAVLSRRLHRVASYVAALVLLITGYYLMAILLIFLMRGAGDFSPLDDVSPLSLSRKLAFIGGIIMLVMTYVILPNPFIPQL